jgi:predicted dehydrogenase
LNRGGAARILRRVPRGANPVEEEAVMEAFKVGIIGSGFISGVHITSLRTIPGVEVAAVADVDAKRGRAICRRFGIQDFHPAIDDLLARPDVSMIWVCVPNKYHAPLALAALKKGKHVVVEKPLALSLDDCDRIAAEAAKRELVVGYAEELCYLPKFVHAKGAADEGAVGKVFFVKQGEKHGGAYSEWFYRPEIGGGGILMDMGCHAIECCRWVLGKPRATAVTAHMDCYVQHETKWKSQVEDHVVLHVEFENGATALVESAWTLQGGMTSVLEIHGTQGVIHADLLQQGMGLRVFSAKGYGPKEDRKDRTGWHYPDWEWHWQNGYPQEDADFVRAAKEGGTPVETAEDGRAVLEIMLAGYLSAGTGRTVALPYKPPKGLRAPVDLWLKNKKKPFGVR